MGKRHISLKDLAKELDVSISTVSRALKNHPEISPELTKKIQALAAERNYTPNPLAMGLLRQQTKMIGVIVPDINTHFYSSIISGIESVAKEQGYFIVIASSNESMDKEIESVENLLKSRVEGFIVCLSQETNDFSHFEKLIKNEIPLVFFDRVCEELPVPAVLANGQDATRKITKHFYENGCKRIAYISGPEHLNISQNRKEGYLNGLQECGLQYDKNLLVHCNLSINDAILATRKLLQLENKPDAIFGVNDTIAFAAMIEVKKQGYKIPDDISLAGFTDEFHSIVVDPPLTSVSHPTFQMGEEAARLFFESIVNGKIINKKVMLPIDLVVRKSSLKK
ncbi:LacI family DNA-binding transcriptional regulator [uncultured Draconibacterium sp.]|uniref:LacI family DNA-binding transcriptional regulator n=1 Tax=uncultured Draconibacterium sp. TaxID=1573823 RepID=UPI003217CE13